MFEAWPGVLAKSNQHGMRRVFTCPVADSPWNVTGATFFKWVADSGWDKLFPYNIREPFMALSMHLNIISTQISQMPEVMKFGSAAVLIGLILFINSFAIVLRVWLRGHKRW